MNMNEIENILLFSMEDLNDWISPLGGHPQTVTPNLERLAHRSFIFDHAYAAAPACSPSRTAALFGQAPWKSGIYTNRECWGQAYDGNFPADIIAQVKAAGWETHGAGKIFHGGKCGQSYKSWTSYYQSPKDLYPPISAVVKEGNLPGSDDFGPLKSGAQVYDERILTGIKQKILPGAKKHLWAFGTMRPHLPFVVPERYFDRIPSPVDLPPGMLGKAFDPYDLKSINHLPQMAKRLIKRQLGLGRKLFESGEFNDFIRAYLASVNFADDILGQLLDHLETCGLMDNTLVIFWSDHGLQFGEKLAFRKFTMWERALRVPLMISVPGMEPGRISEEVSLLDIYPTLAQICGSKAPHELDGQDLLPLLKGEAGRGSAVSSWIIPNPDHYNKANCIFTVRANGHRLIAYPNFEFELYNNETDPFETKNLFENAMEEQPELLEKLMSAIPGAEADPLWPDGPIRQTDDAMSNYSDGRMAFE